MAQEFVLSDYIEAAMDGAVYDELGDGSFAGRIPDCPGVVAFATSLADCERELRSTLEDWLLVGLKPGIARALERELRDSSDWSPGFFERLSERDPDVADAVEELLREVNKARSENGLGHNQR